MKVRGEHVAIAGCAAVVMFAAVMAARDYVASGPDGWTALRTIGTAAGLLVVAGRVEVRS